MPKYVVKNVPIQLNPRRFPVFEMLEFVPITNFERHVKSLQVRPDQKVTVAEDRREGIRLEALMGGRTWKDSIITSFGPLRPATSKTIRYPLSVSSPFRPIAIADSAARIDA